MKVELDVDEPMIKCARCGREQLKEIRKLVPRPLNLPGLAVEDWVAPLGWEHVIAFGWRLYLCLACGPIVRERLTVCLNEVPHTETVR